MCHYNIYNKNINEKINKLILDFQWAITEKSIKYYKILVTFCLQGYETIII